MYILYIVRLYENDNNIIYLRKFQAKIVYLFGSSPRTLFSAR